MIWSWELFILGEEPYYSTKRIMIKKGNQILSAEITSNKPVFHKQLREGETALLVQERKEQKQTLAEFKAQKVEYPVWTPARWFRFCITMSWCFVLWLGTGVRIMIDDGHYFMYFTNWIWTFNLVFYSFDFIGFLDFTNQVHFYLIYGVLWMFFGQVSVVFWEVNFILYEAPQLMTDQAEKYGYGTVIVAEKLVHTFPYIVILVWLMCAFPEIIKVLATFPWVKGHKLRFVGYVAMNFAFAQVPFGIYMANYDFNKVYQVTYPFWFGVILSEFLFLISIVLPIMILSPMLARLRKGLYKPIRSSKKYRTYPVKLKKQRVKDPNIVLVGPPKREPPELPTELPEKV